MHSTPSTGDRADRQFALMLGHLFSTAKSDAEYAAIFQEFAGRPLESSGEGETGLLLPGSVADGDPVQRFHDAAEWRAEHDFEVPLPGLANGHCTEVMSARLLAAISDPAAWRQQVLRWKEYARDTRILLGEQACPTLEAEYQLYQQWLAAWPAHSVGAADTDSAFAAALFENEEGHLFRKSFIPWAEANLERAATLSLSALVLQCTSPGVPLIADAPSSDTGASVLEKLLALRERWPGLFGKSKYRTQKLRGKHADHCVAFTREVSGGAILVAVPRSLPDSIPAVPVDAWDKTAIEICGIAHIHWKNVFTGAASMGPYITLNDAFRELPVAVFITENAAPI